MKRHSLLVLFFSAALRGGGNPGFWPVLQVEEGHLSTCRRQIVVPDSGHMIPFERPDTVISENPDVWSTARWRKSSRTAPV